MNRGNEHNPAVFLLMLESFKKLSKLRKLALCFAFLGLAGVIWVFVRRDAYIVDAVQTYGTAILGVSVKLKGARLDIPGQSLELRGLSVANPAGFKGSTLMQLGRIFVQLDVASLAGEVVLIREIVIEKPEINYEKAGGKTNVDVIQKNANQFVSGGEPLPTVKKKGKPAPEKRWIISHLVMGGARASVLSDDVLTPNLKLALPDLHLRDIGKKSHGATTADATQQVVAAVTSGVTNAVGNALSGLAKGVGSEVTKGAKAIGGVFEGLFKKKGR